MAPIQRVRAFPLLPEHHAGKGTDHDTCFCSEILTTLAAGYLRVPAHDASTVHCERSCAQPSVVRGFCSSDIFSLTIANYVCTAI